MQNGLYQAKLLMLMRKIKFAGKVMADISDCIRNLAKDTEDPDLLHAFAFYEGSANSAHLLLESLFVRAESRPESQPVDELCRLVRMK